MELPAFLLLIGILVVAILGIRTASRRAKPKNASRDLPGPDGPPVDPPAGHADPDPPVASPVESLYGAAQAAAQTFQAASRPEDFLSTPPFQAGVETLNGDGFTDQDRFDYCFGDHFLISCMALEAFAQGTPPAELRGRLLDHLNDGHPWIRFFALRALSTCDRTHEFGSRTANDIVFGVLAKLDESWWVASQTHVLETFLGERLAGEHGDQARADIRGTYRDLDYPVQALLYSIMRRLDPELAKSLDQPQRKMSPLPEAMGQPAAPAADPDALLNEIGRFLPVPPEPTWVEHDALRRTTDSLLELLGDKEPHSILLVGESGVGKTTIYRALAHGLRKKRWRVFEASATDVVAGQKYVGQLEERVKNMVRALSPRRRTVWICPAFHEMIWAGVATDVPRSLLRMLLPHIERGELVLLGETTTSGHDRLLQHYPRLRAALHTATIAPLPERESLAVLKKWSESNRIVAETPLIARKDLAEAQNLAQQYLRTLAPPGNLFSLVRRARERVTARKATRVIRDDILAALSERTGLPLAILDDRKELQLERVREVFEKNVLGQPDALDCLVERMAMIKAGVTDPTRPLGVFLFVGPTGTGKTELAKTLAGYLFGSPERMIRLDMSEIQTAADLGRITGEDQPMLAGASLVNRIRSHPFSVILLDEFEKAHPRAWDMFLQVFDDGRLTDRNGDTVDFRHSVVIMTSNAGFEHASAVPIGFWANQPLSARPARGTAVDRKLRKTFRPELLNRIDRVVEFRPLDRATMRVLIRKELDEALQRRGLRTRSWAVEWDSSAVEFLLEEGFTRDLGARPLRRAVERHLLAPLSRTIVKQEAPEGDQFLFIRSDGSRIIVTFVDPDAPEEVTASRAPSRELTLESLVLDPAGDSDEVAFLRDVYEETRSLVRGPSWSTRKERAFSKMAESGFWELPDRFVTLGEAEFMDRIEAGLETAGSLLDRLSKKSSSGRAHYPTTLLQGLAQQLFLLGVACRDLESGAPRDAFLLVEGSAGNGYARQLGEMYRNWARKRRMRVETLEESTGADHRLLLAVSGFGAHSLLANESGLHVFEIPSGDHRVERFRIRVQVVPQTDSPPREPGDLRAQATAELEGSAHEAPRVVRTYRLGGAPLVRDRIRRWRTGRPERVFAGDFDLIHEQS